ncbi:MAG TPA: phosphoribosyltransferase family protein [Thermomicrobiales bacterium]|jgi:orotate phosphoribosyltransferase/uridine monophosphate synthetase
MVGSAAQETNLWLAQALFDLGGVTLGDFTIGRTTVNSPVYINPRVLISNPEVLRRVARLIDREVQAGMSRKRDPIPPFDLIAGVPLGGLHLATAYALSTNTPMIYVRPADNSAASVLNGHGIEGRFQPGQRVLLIDDLITTGGSILQTRAVLEAADLIVKDVVVLVDREQGGREQLRQHGYDLLHILTLRAMLTYYVNTNRISEDEYERCLAYLEGER